MSPSRPGVIERDDPRGLAHAVAATLRRSIADGELAQGDRVPSESELAGDLDVSRTVVREAVSRLRAEGLVETFKGRGSFVVAVPQEAVDGPRGSSASAPAHSAEDVMELRLAIETEAAALAARRAGAAGMRLLDQALEDLRSAAEEGRSTVAADWAFHIALVRACGNRLILQALQELGPDCLLRHRASLTHRAAGQAEHRQQLLIEHELVRDAIARGDGEAARAAVRVHLGRSLAALGRR